MRLETYCKNCQEKIEFNEFFSDRGELSLVKGNNIELTCKKCYSKGTYHPNEIRAIKRRIIRVIALVISVLGMIIILTFFWKLNLEHADYFENQPNVAITKKILALLVIPLIIYQMILSIENKKVKRFNSYKIK